MWFFIGLTAGMIIGVLLLSILQAAKHGDKMIKKVQMERKKDDVFNHFLPERRKGERRVSQ
jgi:uncharacterized membrane-anchored protein YhcB (DUF1043 family)